MPAVDQVTQLFVHNVLPVLCIMAAGYVAQKRLNLDIVTLNRLNLYVFVPGLLLACLMNPGLDLGASGVIAVLCAAHQVALLGLGWFLCRVFRVDRDSAATASLAAMSGNCGNFGIPLIELAFGPAGVALQAVVIAISNLGCYTLGVAAVSYGKHKTGGLVASLLRLPSLYAVALALALRHCGRALPGPVAVAVDYVYRGLVPVALVTLGAQLAAARGRGQPVPLTVAVVLRLVVAPLMMYGLVRLVGVNGLAARVLVVGAAVPAAVNTVVLAVEFDNQPSLAAHIVLVTTLLAAVTVSVALYGVSIAL